MNVLELSTITKTYPHPTNAIEVLKGVNFAVERGETVAILGPSGSGKSTLLALMAGLDVPSSGNVVLMGKGLGELSEKELSHYRAKHMGIVFQQFHLMANLNALENVTLPLQIADQADYLEQGLDALAAVGLKDRAHHFPHELSGGECQRVAIARAMVVTPDVLLADEPSGNLDEGTGEQVMQLLFDLVDKQDMTLILVTHNRELAARCRRQLVLSDGRLVDG